MHQCLKFYIAGQWVAPLHSLAMDIVNPGTETVSGNLALGTSADVDRAVRAARRVAPSYAAWSRSERIDLLRPILGEYGKRTAELVAAVTEEMEAPTWLSREAQVPSGAANIETAVGVLEQFKFEKIRGSTLLRFEPIGVCGLITPWNWPLNQITAMLAPALAVGCPVVWKPAELAPLSAQILAEVAHAAGVPPECSTCVRRRTDSRGRRSAAIVMWT